MAGEVARYLLPGDAEVRAAPNPITPAAAVACGLGLVPRRGIPPPVPAATRCGVAARLLPSCAPACCVPVEEAVAATPPPAWRDVELPRFPLPWLPETPPPPMPHGRISPPPPRAEPLPPAGAQCPMATCEGGRGIRGRRLAAACAAPERGDRPCSGEGDPFRCGTPGACGSASRCCRSLEVYPGTAPTEDPKATADATRGIRDPI